MPVFPHSALTTFFKKIRLTIFYIFGHKRVVVAALIEKDGKFLIAERKKGTRLGGLWEFPGGKLEPGETHRECLKRELMEELAIQTDIGEVFSSTRFTYNYVPIQLIVYKTRHVSGEYILHDHDAIAWVSRDEFSRYNFVPADKPVVEKLLRPT